MNTSKIHFAFDALGLPVAFEITGGEINDFTIAPELIEELPPAKTMVGDKGYDSVRIRKLITSKSARAAIPRKENSRIGNDDIDWCLYKYRHLVGNAFARLNQCRAIATRYDRLMRNHESMVAMVCGYLWLPM